MTSGIRIQTDSVFCPVFVPAMCAVVVAKSGKVALANAGTTCMKSLLLLLLFVVMLGAGAIAAAAATFGHNLSGHLDPPEIENVKNQRRKN